MGALRTKLKVNRLAESSTDAGKNYGGLIREFKFGGRDRQRWPKKRV